MVETVYTIFAEMFARLYLALVLRGIPLPLVFCCGQVRKLWAKMTDREWQVAVKALYVIHRFAANGNIDHAVNLKESVAVLRSHHDSRRKVSRVS